MAGFKEIRGKIVDIEIPWSFIEREGFNVMTATSGPHKYVNDTAMSVTFN